MSLTEAEASGAWSVADEMLLHFEASRTTGAPIIMGDFVGLAVKVAAGGDAESLRANAIHLGAIAMRIALGDRLIVDVEEKPRAA